jgi:hypothetical protein
METAPEDDAGRMCNKEGPMKAQPFINPKQSTEWRTYMTNPVFSDCEPGIHLYNALCKALGHEPEFVKSMTVRFEVGEPIKFTFEFMPREETVLKVTETLQSWLRESKPIVTERAD